MQARVGSWAQCVSTHSSSTQTPGSRRSLGRWAHPEVRLDRRLQMRSGCPLSRPSGPAGGPWGGSRALLRPSAARARAAGGAPPGCVCRSPGLGRFHGAAGRIRHCPPSWPASWRHDQTPSHPTVRYCLRGRRWVLLREKLLLFRDPVEGAPCSEASGDGGGPAPSRPAPPRLHTPPRDVYPERASLRPSGRNNKPYFPLTASHFHGFPTPSSRAPCWVTFPGEPGPWRANDQTSHQQPSVTSGSSPSGRRTLRCLLLGSLGGRNSRFTQGRSVPPLPLGQRV